MASLLTLCLMPKPYSALSSKSEFDQEGPRPSLRLQYGVVGKLPPYIEEQPVALAISIRSPKSWVTNLMYGVSPQAPENSNRGRLSWLPLTVASPYRTASPAIFKA